MVHVLRSLHKPLPELTSATLPYRTPAPADVNTLRGWSSPPRCRIAPAVVASENSGQSTAP